MIINLYLIKLKLMKYKKKTFILLVNKFPNQNFNRNLILKKII